jgi:hypothetical protein
MISTNLRIVAIAGSFGLLVLVVDLVRRRRLKEEYSALWVIVAVVLLVLAAWGGLLHSLTHAIGAVSESSTLYFFGLLFIILLLLNFSVRVSLLERRLTALVQEIALLGTDRYPPPHREASAESGSDPAAPCGPQASGRSQAAAHASDDSPRA